MLSFAVILLLGAFASTEAALSVNVISTQRLQSPCPGLLLPFKTCPVDVTVLTLEFSPGDVGDVPHSHNGPAAGYIIEGEFLFQVRGQPHRIIKAGSSFYEDNGAVHLWGANASNSTVCKAVVTVFGQPGKDLVKYVTNTRTESWAEAVDMAARGV